MRFRAFFSLLTLRDFVVGAILFVTIFAVIFIPAYVQQQRAELTLTVTCTSVEANISQLEALNDIAKTLGIPTHFPIPTVPPECV